MPVKSLPLEPVEAVRAWFVAIVVADSRVELCIAFAFDVVGGFATAMPNFSASEASVWSKSSSVSPSSNCSTWRQYSGSLCSNVVVVVVVAHCSGFCMASSERLRGMGAMVVDCQSVRRDSASNCGLLVLQLRCGHPIVARSRGSDDINRERRVQQMILEMRSSSRE